MIKIDFSKTHEVYGDFADAIHLPEDHDLSDQDIENIKQQRHEAWLAQLTKPPSTPPGAKFDPESIRITPVDV